MACEVIRCGGDGPGLPGSLKAMIFRCDEPGCVMSPTDEEIIAAGGMTKMGWDCRGGKHYCPAHRKDKETN